MENTNYFAFPRLRKGVSSTDTLSIVVQTCQGVAVLATPLRIRFGDAELRSIHTPMFLFNENDSVFGGCVQRSPFVIFTFSE